MDQSINQLLSKDFTIFEKKYRLNFFNSLSGFKSLHLCGTRNKEGQTNLAIFNSIIHIGSNPPLLGMFINPPVSRRDTLNNLRESGFFTLNHITEKTYFKAHQTAASYDSNRSEFDVVKLTPEYSDNISAPYVKESPVKIGLKCVEDIPLKSNGKILIVGEVIEVILPKNSILSDGMIDLGITGTITGTGLDTYYSTQKIARLSFAETNGDLGIIG